MKLFRYILLFILGLGCVSGLVVGQEDVTTAPAVSEQEQATDPSVDTSTGSTETQSQQISEPAASDMQALGGPVAIKPDQQLGGSGIVNALLKMTMFGSEWVLWLLIIISVVSLAVIVERIVYFKNSSVEFESFVQGLVTSLDKDDMVEADALVTNQPSLEARVVKAGLECAKKGTAAIEKSMSSRLAGSRSEMDKGLMFLGTMGNNAPFIGLFGTVLGIIQAFNDLALNPEGGPSVVMAGISEALVATAVGLFVAIPAVIAFNAFQKVITERLNQVDALQDLMLKHFSSRERG